jgi:hypothetical protein
MHTVPIQHTSEKTLGCVTRGYSSNFRIILAQQFSESFSTVLAVFSSFLLQKYNPRESGLRILIFVQLLAIKKLTVYNDYILLIRGSDRGLVPDPASYDPIAAISEETAQYF